MGKLFVLSTDDDLASGKYVELILGEGVSPVFGANHSVTISGASVPGSPGLQGIQGIAGNDGAQGQQGIQGIQGPKGDTGNTGATGTTDWNALTNKPTTLGGFGITDAEPLVGSSAATSATTGTMTVNMTTDIITITPTGACTFNAANGGNLGRIVTFVITTSGTSSFTLTFGTNFRKVGTLATGTTSARFFAVTFRYIATNTWMEIARTAAQT